MHQPLLKITRAIYIECLKNVSMIGAIVITHLLGIQFYIEMLFFLTHDHFGILGQKSAS